MINFPLKDNFLGEFRFSAINCEKARALKTLLNLLSSQCIKNKKQRNYYSLNFVSSGLCYRQYSFNYVLYFLALFAYSLSAISTFPPAAAAATVGFRQVIVVHRSRVNVDEEKGFIKGVKS